MEVVSAGPAVQHGLCMRLAILIHENGVFSGRIEVARFDHISVQYHASIDIDFEEFRRLRNQRAHFLAQLLVAFEYANHPMPGKLHELDDRRLIER